VGACECLKALRLFSEIGDEELAMLAEKAEKLQLKKDDIIFTEGEPASKIFVVKNGRVKLYKLSEDGKELILGFLTGDNVIGEDSVFNGENYSMSAIAIDECCVTVFTREAIEEVIMQSPGIALKIIENLSRKLNLYTEQVGELAFRDAKGRLAGALMRLADEHGSLSREGVTIGLSLTHEELASLVNVSRTTVTNLLLDLRDEGLIRIKNRRIVLLDQFALKQWAS
jgi:CRP/FNR family cyclic AMP-dependent transcriptional regulator